MELLEENGVPSDLIRMNLAPPTDADPERNEAEWQGRNARVEITVLDEVLKNDADHGSG
jgi:hypothetical protein